MLVDAITGWVLFGGLTLTTGAAVGHWVVLPRAAAGDVSHLRSWRSSGARLGLGGALLVVAGLTLYFARQMAEFRDPFAPWTEDASLLLRSPWGRSWMAAAVASVAATAALAGARSGRGWGWAVATPLVLALGAFPGLTGHAAGAESLATLTLVADAAHVWAAGAWIGGLALVLYIERDRRRQDGPAGSALPALVPSFSPVAMAGVGTLAVTGLFASWSHLPGWSALIDTTYGNTLLVKLFVVAGVLGLGARNFRILTPRLGTDAGDESMRRSASLELVVAQVVLILTAMLVRMSPTDHG